MRAVAALMMVPGAGNELMTKYSAQKYVYSCLFYELSQNVFNGLLNFSDKHPQLNEFLTQIKNTPDLSNLFESIQKDSNSAGGVEGSYYSSGSMSMDLS